jgi:transcriptional regulator with XRE-family HTH domain
MKILPENNIASRRLHDERIRIGYLRNELAYEIGVNPATISQWEQGKAFPRGVWIFQQLESIFNRSIRYLFGLTDDDTPLDVKRERGQACLKERQ